MDAEGGRRITLGQTITRAVLVTLHGDRGFTPQLSDSCEVLATVSSQGVLWDRPWENLTAPSRNALPTPQTLRQPHKTASFERFCSESAWDAGI